eukprot:4091272-Alexandrium_andersonii.AAC.1
MSASLVGSEMCIRDRRWSKAVHSQLDEDRLETQHRALESASSGWIWWGCLLYTSDAADDM